MTSVEISEQLLCLFSARVIEDDGTYTIEVPKHEVETGDVTVGDTYRVAVIEPGRSESAAEVPNDQPEPPVDVGETRYVEIEDIGKQGDGIARVERGYVIIVPGTKIGDRVKVEIAEVKPNFAVGETVEETF